MPDPRTIQQSDNLDAFQRKVRSYFDDAPAACKVTAGAEVGNARRITFQVRDRLLNDWADRWVVYVYIAATTGGDPSSTGNTVAAVAGTVILDTLTANAAYVLLTDADGQAQIDVTIAGSATRYFYSVVVGRAKESPSVGWT